jgi:hypothetical protein
MCKTCAYAQEGVCSGGRVLTRACAHEGVCSGGRVLTRACAHEGVCSRGRVLTRACAHEGVCSALQHLSFDVAASFCIHVCGCCAHVLCMYMQDSIHVCMSPAEAAPVCHCCRKRPPAEHADQRTVPASLLGGSNITYTCFVQVQHDGSVKRSGNRYIRMFDKCHLSQTFGDPVPHAYGESAFFVQENGCRNPSCLQKQLRSSTACMHA